MSAQDYLYALEFINAEGWAHQEHEKRWRAHKHQM